MGFVSEMQLQKSNKMKFCSICSSFHLNSRSTYLTTPVNNKARKKEEKICYLMNISDGALC